MQRAAQAVTHPCDFDALGFAPAVVPGHALTDTTQPNNYHSTATCTCGKFSTYFYLRKNGLAGGRALTAWTDHMDTLCADPDEAFLIGSITTKRLYHELLVAPSTFNGLGPYLDGNRKRSNSWLDNPSMGARWMVLRRTRPVDGTKWRYRIDQSWHNSKARATAAAERLLAKAIADGEQVTGAHSMARSKPVSITAQFSAASLVERTYSACESGDANDVASVLAELDALLESLPILEAMRAKLYDKVRIERSA